MIVDLEKPLYVMDENTHKHRIKSFNILEKTVTCIDGLTFEYSTTNLTVVIGEDE